VGILEKQDFVTGELKISQKILTHELSFLERKILFAPLSITVLWLFCPTQPNVLPLAMNITILWLFRLT
jgi:hypothetical protein